MPSSLGMVSMDLKTMWFKRQASSLILFACRVIGSFLRALRERSLEVVDLWSVRPVRPLAHQLAHSTQRRKVGEFVLHEQDDPEEGCRTWATKYSLRSASQASSLWNLRPLRLRL